MNSTLSEPKTNNEISTRACVDSLLENSRKRRGLLPVVNNQDSEFDEIKSTNLVSFTGNSKPLRSEEVSDEKHNDDDLGRSTIRRFFQKFGNYIKVSVGIDRYILQEFE